MPCRASRLLLLLFATLPLCAQTDTPRLRAPATPLVVHDPYLSVWSVADRLTGDATRHWSGKAQPLNGLIRIDGRAYRFLGNAGANIPAMEETGRTLTPTRTSVTEAAAGIELTVTFLDAALPSDLPRLARPVTYLEWSARATDGKRHQVALYLNAAGTLASNDATEDVVASRGAARGLDWLRIGTKAQPVLARSGDDVRIDWGYFYLAAPKGPGAALAIGDASAQKHTAPVLSVVMPLGKVGAAAVSRHVLLAYDEIYPVEYMHRRLLPYWRNQYADTNAMLADAERDLPAVERLTHRLDSDLTAALTRTGGAEYADIGVLAYRQALAAHALVLSDDGTPYLMPKENFSGGFISTMDVIYPSAPVFLLLNPKLVEAQLLPVLLYAETPRWKFPFAPHDLGYYPLANGQKYGGGEQTEVDQMPVEESGNVLLLVAAIAQAEGNADFARRFWPLLEKWAGYLAAHGLDPENQLSTDDFAGHLAHNANLSIKAIEALGAYAELARQLGHEDEAAKYQAMAREMAGKWVDLAADGDHYKLAFDKPGTWSQKYNLVWDRVLGLNLFPPTVAETEVAFYTRHLNRCGLPLDDRKTYTKLDWEVWTATLATNPRDFQTLVHPIWTFLNQTPDRVPMTDWYDTVSGKMTGFQARSVVGGVYMPMLASPEMWQRWAAPPGR